MTITAKLPGTCYACKGAILPGCRILWVKGTPSRHEHCPTKPQAPQAPHGENGIPVLAERKGYFTFVDGSGRRTLRFLPGKDKASAGTTFVGLLTGPSNTSSYACIGYVKGGLFRYARAQAFRAADPLTDAAVRFLCAADAIGLAAAGSAYALESGRCFRCNALLTTPESIALGLGPVCAANSGYTDADLAALTAEKAAADEEEVSDLFDTEEPAAPSYANHGAAIAAALAAYNPDVLRLVKAALTFAALHLPDDDRDGDAMTGLLVGFRTAAAAAAA